MPARGTAIYVVLKPDKDGIYRPTAAYRAKPAVQEDEVVLKWRVEYSWSDGVNVKYGLERYYVQEGTGKRLEKEAAANMIVRVQIAPWGQARISKLEL